MSGCSAGKPTVPLSPMVPSNARAAVDALLGGIPEQGNVIGSSTALVTLQYFSDLSCPRSREMTTGTLAKTISRWVRPGKLRIEYRSVQEGTDSEEGFAGKQAAALAAGIQDKLWYYLEYFYRAQDEQPSNEIDSCYVAETLPQIVARQVPGLNFAKWAVDRLSHSLVSKAIADLRIAVRADLQNPSFLIGRTGARTATKLSEFARANPAYGALIRELLATRLGS